MIRFFKSASFKITIAVTVALLIGIVFAAASRSGYSPLTAFTGIVFSPVSRLADKVVDVFSELPISFKSSSSLQKEIDELNKQIDTLKGQMVDYEEVKHQNDFYEKFLNIKEEHPQYEFAYAQIVGRDASNYLSQFTLNKGKKSSIKVNDPVIYGEYLIGVVTAVSSRQCTVETILNPKVNVSAYETRTGELGYVTTTISYAEKNLCQMPGLSSQTAITNGGIVCTSGVGGIYPADLIIGTVSEIIDETADISACAVITPGVELDLITDVFVITKFD